MFTKPLKTAIPLTIASLIFVGFPLTLARAQEMTNDEFILELNPTKTLPAQSPTPEPTDSPKQALLNPKNTSLSFKVSNNIVNYGAIKAGEPIIRDVQLEAKSPFGFTVVAFEQDALKSEDNQPIPDVTCDEGTCTQLVAAKWSSPLTYGFGYSCEAKKGDTCSSSFVDQTTYKQFANISISEKPENVLTSFSNKNVEAKINLKVNIPAHLNELHFSNTIHLIALPKLESKK